MTGVTEAAGPAWSRRRTLVQNPNRSGVRSVITTVKRPPSVSRPGRPASRPAARGPDSLPLPRHAGRRRLGVPAHGARRLSTCVPPSSPSVRPSLFSVCPSLPRSRAPAAWLAVSAVGRVVLCGRALAAIVTFWIEALSDAWSANKSSKTGVGFLPFNVTFLGAKVLIFVTFINLPFRGCVPQ